MLWASTSTKRGVVAHDAVQLAAQRRGNGLGAKDPTETLAAQFCCDAQRSSKLQLHGSLGRREGSMTRRKFIALLAGAAAQSTAFLGV